MKISVAIVAVVLLASAHAESENTVLPAVTVYSPRVANQAPVATFAMPVSALRFEPQVDIHPRNFSEGQADITIRGGIFENSGFKIGALTLYDPQTGHYLSEIPVAPAMLTAPAIMTGVENTFGAINSTSGTIAYQWRPVREGGAVAVGAGDYGLAVGEFYQGYTADAPKLRAKVGADVAWAHSEANGSVQHGDHLLNRVDGRIQLASTGRFQTDLFVGYQEKFFGWPNLYTPFNSAESENLKTLLVSLNHRVEFGANEFLNVGAYYRRNRDDYAFNRFAPVGPVHPFNHVTWVKGVAADGRRTAGDVTVNFLGEFTADDIHSTSLTFGNYHTRSLARVALVPERAWALANGGEIVVKAGAAYDDSNRSSGAVSPVFEIAREQSSAAAQRVYFSYSEATQLPTYTALNSNAAAGLFRGNPNLGRQRTRNLELGTRATWAGWTGQAAAFYRRDDALVDWTFRRGVTARSANAVDVATTGFETVARHATRRFDVVLGYTWLSKEPDYRGASVDASFYALNYARHRLTAAVTMRVTSELTLRLDNVARIQSANFLRTVGGDDAWVSALGIGYRPAALRGFEFSLQADNLWNSDFQDIPAVPAARRQVSTRVAYTW